MSIAEIARFAGDLNASEALRAEAAKQATVSQAAALEDLVTFASSKGYTFTADDLKKHVKAAGKALTDGELDGIAGGRGFLGPWGFFDVDAGG